MIVGSVRVIALATLLALSASGAAKAAPTWTSTFPLEFATYDVAMAPGGTTVYAGTARVENVYRSAVRVRPPGGPLGPVQLLSDASGSTVEVAAGPDGRFLAAWLEGSLVRTAVLMPSSSSFGEARTMPAASDSPTGHMAVAVDGAGNGHVLWAGQQLNGTQSTIYVRHGTRPADAAATQSVAILDQHTASTSMTSIGFFGLSIGTSADGAAIAAWQRSHQTFSPNSTELLNRAALKPAAGSFAAPITLDHVYNGSSTVGFLYAPEATMNGSGRAAVAWTKTDSSTNTAAVHLRVADAGGELGATEYPAAEAGTFPFLYGLAIDDAGRVYTGWVAAVGGVQRAQVSRRSAEGVLSPAQTLAANATPAVYLGLAAAPDGHVIATYTTGGCAYFAAHAPPGGAFGEVLAVGAPFESSCHRPQVDVIAGGDGVLALRGVRGSAYVDEAAGLDASGPVLRDLQVPAVATVGVPAAFAVAPVDVWGTVATTSWTFGEGATASGPTASHTFPTAGEPTVTVTATDALGHATTAARQVRVSTTAVGSGSDLVAPVLSALGLTRRVFAVARAGTVAAPAARRRVKRGTTFGFTLSEKSAVEIRFARARPGRRAASKRCVKPTRADRRRRRCTRFVPAGKITASGVAGANRLPFSGRIARRALKPGRYRATFTATDEARNVSEPATLRFRVVRIRR